MINLKSKFKTMKNQKELEISELIKSVKELIKLIKEDKNKVLTFEQGCEYLGYAKSTIYKMTSAGILPYSKPNGGSIFFERKKLEEWMLSNVHTSRAQKEIEAATYISIHKLK
jgi:excisionase family DNA binding protein